VEGARPSEHGSVWSAVVWALGIGYGIFNPRLFERSQAQSTTVAYAAGHIFRLVAGPSVRERRAKLHSAPDDFALPHADDRRNDFKLCFRLRTGSNHTVEGLVVDRAAIRIPGTVLLHRAHKDFARAQDFPPGNGNGQEVRVAKRHVTGRNLLALQIGWLDSQGGVRQARTTNLPKVAQMTHQAMFRMVEIRQRVESAKLACFSSLAVGDVQHRQAVIKASNSRSNAAIHAAAGKNDGEWLVRGPWPVVCGHHLLPALD